MNVTVPTGLPGTMTILKDDTREPAEIFGSNITASYSGGTGDPTYDQFTIWLLNINEHAAPYSPWPTLSCTENSNLGFTCTLAYEKTITVPLPGRNDTWSVSVPGQAYDTGIFLLRDAETCQFWAYSLATGAHCGDQLEEYQQITK